MDRKKLLKKDSSYAQQSTALRAIVNDIAEFKALALMQELDNKQKEEFLKNISGSLETYTSLVKKMELPTPYLQKFSILWDSLKLIKDENDKVYIKLKSLLLPIFENSFELQLAYYSRVSFSSFVYFVEYLDPIDGSFELDDELKEKAKALMKNLKPKYQNVALESLSRNVKIFGTSFLDKELWVLLNRNFNPKKLDSMLESIRLEVNNAIYKELAEKARAFVLRCVLDSFHRKMVLNHFKLIKNKVPGQLIIKQA